MTPNVNCRVHIQPPLTSYFSIG